MPEHPEELTAHALAHLLLAGPDDPVRLGVGCVIGDEQWNFVSGRPGAVELTRGEDGVLLYAVDPDGLFEYLDGDDEAHEYEERGLVRPADCDDPNDDEEN